MAGHQCLRCRSAFRQAFQTRQALTTCKRQHYSSTTTSTNKPAEPSSTEPTVTAQKIPPKPQLDVAALLSKPTWSVRSLLPPIRSTTLSDPQTSTAPTPSITPTQLHHLLRLSALPQPSSPAEEETMLRTLETQLHFVRAIQAVDTAGVKPLVTLRDETEEGIRKSTIGLENPRIQEALGAERKVGRMGRVRRRRDAVEDRRSQEEREWKPLEGAKGRTAGKYFVVHSGKSGGSIGGFKNGGDGAEVPKDEKRMGENAVLEKPI